MGATKLDFKKIADKYGISKDEVQHIYFDTFEFIHNTISSLDYTDLTDEELNSIKSSFQLPGLGKLYLDKDKVKKLAKLWKKQ